MNLLTAESKTDFCVTVCVYGTVHFVPDPPESTTLYLAVVRDVSLHCYPRPFAGNNTAFKRLCKCCNSLIIKGYSNELMDWRLDERLELDGRACEFLHASDGGIPRLILERF